MVEPGSITSSSMTPSLSLKTVADVNESEDVSLVSDERVMVLVSTSSTVALPVVLLRLEVRVWETMILDDSSLVSLTRYPMAIM